MHDSFLMCSYRLLCSASVTNTSEGVSLTTSLNHVCSCLVYSLMAQSGWRTCSANRLCHGGGCVLVQVHLKTFLEKQAKIKLAFLVTGSLVTFSQSRTDC